MLRVTRPGLAASIRRSALVSTSVCRILARPKARPCVRQAAPVSEFLATVLKDELKIEKERYRQSEELMDGPPRPWQVEDRPFTNVIALSRSFQDEEILVQLDLEAQDGDDEEDEDYDADADEAPLVPVRFQVSMSKDGGALLFDCQSDGQQVIILHMSLEDGTDDEVPVYTGPVFSELDETLQQAFLDYLEERGVTAEFAEYLMELVNDKLEVEYMNWLQRIERFVTK